MQGAVELALRTYFQQETIWEGNHYQLKDINSFKKDSSLFMSKEEYNKYLKNKKRNLGSVDEYTTRI